LAAPVKGTPLSLKVTVPRFPGDGETVAVKVTNWPPVVALGVAVKLVVEASVATICHESEAALASGVALTSTVT